MLNDYLSGWWFLLPYKQNDAVAYSTTQLIGVNAAVYTDFTLFDPTDYTNGMHFSNHFFHVKSQQYGIDIIKPSNNVFLKNTTAQDITIDGNCTFNYNTIIGEIGGSATEISSIKILNQSIFTQNYFFGQGMYKVEITNESYFGDNILNRGSIYECVFNNTSYLLSNKLYGGDFDSMNFSHSVILNVTLAGSIYDIYANRSYINSSVIMGGSGMNNIVMNNSTIQDNLWVGSANMNIIQTSFNSVIVKNIPTSAYIIKQSYYKEIFSRVDGTPRMRFVNNTDVMSIGPIA